MDITFQESLVAFQRVQEALDILQKLQEIDKPTKEDLIDLTDVWNSLLTLRNHVLKTIATHPMMRIAHADAALKRILLESYPNHS